MRRVGFLVLMLIGFNSLFSQNVIRETRAIFSEFGTKITKVVIPSTKLSDLMLREAVSKGWRISPFEFCSLDDYHRLKNDPNFFFLLIQEGRYKKDSEPTIDYLTLERGGEFSGRRLIGPGRDIITLPLQSTLDETGQYLHLLPIYIDIIQNHIYKVQQDISLAFKGPAIYSDRVSELRDKELLFSLDLINFTASETEFKSFFNRRVTVVDSDTIESAIVTNKRNAAVPVVITPEGSPNSSFCYKMIISTDTHELLFFRRHRITSRRSAGFTKEDIRKISAPFQF